MLYIKKTNQNAQPQKCLNPKIIWHNDVKVESYDYTEIRWLKIMSKCYVPKSVANWLSNVKLSGAIPGSIRFFPSP